MDEAEIPLERSLPGPSFTAEAEFAREREAVLFADWFCVGREESLATPGDYLTADVAGESILIVRGPARPGSSLAASTTCAGTAAPGSSRWPAAAGRRPCPQRLRGHRDPLPLPRLDLRPRRRAARRAVPARTAPLPRRRRCTRSTSTPGAGSSSCGSRRRRPRWPSCSAARPGSARRLPLADLRTGAALHLPGRGELEGGRWRTTTSATTADRCTPSCASWCPTSRGGGGGARLGRRRAAPRGRLHVHATGTTRARRCPGSPRPSGPGTSASSSTQPDAQPVGGPRGRVHALAAVGRATPSSAISCSTPTR